MIRHFVDFLILLLLITGGLLAISLVGHNIGSQVAVTVIMGVLYVFWGIFHHYHDGYLTIKVVMEYIVMALLISTILIIFLLRV